MSTREITRHGVVTALYVAPAPVAQLRAASLPKLTDYLSRVRATVSAVQWEWLEQGLWLLASQGGPWFERDRYALAQARADALIATDWAGVDPDHFHPN